MSKKKCYIAFGVFLVLAMAVGVAVGLHLRFRESSSSDATAAGKGGYQNHASYKHAAVASDAGNCSKIGAEKLKKGGSVVDAAIATLLCVGLYNAHSSGLGGGAIFSIYHAPSKELISIDSREVAPQAAHRNMYDGNSAFSEGGSLAIAVPGEVAGYWEAHQRYGKLPWADLFQESIKSAKEGIIVDAALANAIKGSQKFIKNRTFSLDSVFMNSNGTLKKEGDTVIRPKLANTLESIANYGANEFYNGTLAKLILKDLDDAVGDSIITLEDLKRYKVEVKPLLNITMGDLTLFTPRPPSSGAVLALIMNILKGYNFTSDNMKDTESSILTYHRIVEAFKFAYAHRSELGDEKFADVEQLVLNMTSNAYADELRKKISDDTTHDSSFYGGDFAQAADAGTTHLSIIGSDGSAVSVTSSINTWFGSKVRGTRTGIIFNNAMNDFSLPNVNNHFGLPPSPNNFIEPQKRPLSSMSPTIILKKGENRPLLVTGAAGGTKITTATAQVTMHSIWFGKSVVEATSSKRLHHQLYPPELQYQDGFDKEILSGLEGKNHLPKRYSGISVAQSVQSLEDSDKITAVSDERKKGSPGGY